jgi:hypothetical protein
MTARALALLLTATAVLAGCSTAEGEGDVYSDQLYIQDCWAGQFQLGPTFFGTNPYNDTQSIRIQRGDNLTEVSDGLNVLVDKATPIRESMLGQEIDVGVPVGVTPAGVPVKFNPNPPIVHLSLYLNDSCHQQNVTIYSISGTIIFHSLFSGDITESNADARYTDAEFHDVTFGDPRQLGPGTETIDPSKTSKVSGWFKFYFQRGQPAQPFQ